MGEVYWDVFKFSEHGIIQDFNFSEQLHYSIRIVLNFDLRANLTRTYEENNTCCTFGLLKDIIMNFKYIMIGELSEPEKIWNTHTQTHPW